MPPRTSKSAEIDPARIAGLLDREDALEERARRLNPLQRAEIEVELIEIRVILETLGFRRSA